jgi:hypothetical protein
LAEEVTVVVEPALALLFTVCVMTAEVLPAKVPSPP